MGKLKESSFGPSPRAWGKPLVPGDHDDHRRTIPTGVGKTTETTLPSQEKSDHPHGRGENPRRTGQPFAPGGPSPRAWGKPPARPRRSTPGRTIPTGVGKTPAAATVLSGTTDHPHGRGENAEVGMVAGRESGPSPRAWGKRPGGQREGHVGRTIPTGVGKTKNSSAARRAAADHPHGRGENTTISIEAFALSGPSPRAWGKLTGVHRHVRQKRTIPTGVGKTFLDVDDDAHAADHPHGRGENVPQTINGATVIGPSPRAWGKRSAPHHDPRPSRTIPTGVGKTARTRPHRRGKADHPHGRGENTGSLTTMLLGLGPSPRAWGKLPRRQGLRRAGRTIPTGVGKTHKLFGGRRQPADHPHGRGENNLARVIHRDLDGPSPRAWGKPILFS